jgi:Bacteriophage minor capsid protein
MPQIVSTFTADLIYLLSNAGAELSLTLTYGTNLFKGPKAKLPDGTGPFVSVIRSVGRGAEGTHNSTGVPAYERPGGQIVVRATDYDVAEDFAKELFAFFYPIRNRMINGTWWRELIPRGEVFDLPPDEKGRARCAFNFDSAKRVSPETSGS